MIDTHTDEKIGFWQSFWGLLIFNVLITGFLFAIFWYFFGTILTTDNVKQYAQDFLATAGSIFTVVGYLLTIYQVSALRTRQETVAATKREMKLETFKVSTFNHIEKAKKDLKDLVNEIEVAEKFSEKSLRAYIEILQQVKHILTGIDANRKAIDDSEPCKVCQDLIHSCIESLTKVIVDKKIEDTDRLFHKSEINSVIQELIKVNFQIYN